jgi:hypothetical protein
MEQLSQVNVQPVCIVHDTILNSKKGLIKTIESYASQILPKENVEIVATCNGLEKPVVMLNFVFNTEEIKTKKNIEIKLSENFAKTLCPYENRDGGGVNTFEEQISKRPNICNQIIDFEDPEKIDFDVIAEVNYQATRKYKKPESFANYNFFYEIFKNNPQIKDNILNFMSCKLKNPEQTDLTIDTSSLPDEEPKVIVEEFEPLDFVEKFEESREIDKVQVEQPRKNFPIAYAVGILVLITAIALGILNYTQKK